MSDLPQEIADLEAEIDALTRAAQRCRTVIVLSKVATGAGLRQPFYGSGRSISIRNPLTLKPRLVGCVRKFGTMATVKECKRI